MKQSIRSYQAENESHKLTGLLSNKAVGHLLWSHYLLRSTDRLVPCYKHMLTAWHLIIWEDRALIYSEPIEYEMSNVMHHELKAAVGQKCPENVAMNKKYESILVLLW